MAPTEWARSLTIYLDTGNQTGALLKPNGDGTGFSTDSTLELIAGDKYALRISFRDETKALKLSLPSGFDVQFVGRASASGDILFLADSFSEDTSDTNEYFYAATLDLGTAEISDAFAALSGTDQLEVVVQVECRDSGNTERITLQFSAILFRDYYTSGAPSGSPAAQAGVFSGVLKVKSLETGNWHAVECHTLEGVTMLSVNQTGAGSP